MAKEVNVCPLCNKRVSEWQKASGKTTIVANEIVHNDCLVDYQLGYKPQKSP